MSLPLFVMTVSHWHLTEESIPLSSPFESQDIANNLQPRTDLCASLFNTLQNVRVVHARGTPTSGKRTLGKVFSAYVNKDYKIHGRMALFVNAVDRYSNENKGRDLRVHDWLQEEANRVRTRPFEGCQNIDAVPNFVIIIDEGNTTYDDLGFWDSLKSTTNQTHYLILCAWGSPTATPNKTDVAAADLQLGPSQGVGFSRNEGRLSMLFTLEEHQDAIRRWTEEEDKITNGLDYWIYLWSYQRPPWGYEGCLWHSIPGMGAWDH